MTLLQALNCKFCYKNQGGLQHIGLNVQVNNFHKVYFCFVHPIFSSFGFWYFGHFSCVIFFLVFFHIAHLALQNVNKDYVIFSYFCNFVAKSDQKRQMG